MIFAMDKTVTFMEIAFCILMAVVGITAIKIGFTFDINEWLKSREEKQKDKLKNICPHVFIENIDGNLTIQSSKISPSGTDAWQCRQCGLVSYAGTSKEEIEYWKNNIAEFGERQRSLKKQAKKMGIL